jgi:polysaccharide export outer membrane protein
VRKAIVSLLLPMMLAGCGHLMPTSGPPTADVRAANSVQVIDIDAGVTTQLAGKRRRTLFSDSLGAAAPVGRIGLGDVLEVSVWEAPPATLFGSGAVDPRLPSSSRAMSLPEQTVDAEGFISVPFAGRIRAAGLTTHALEGEIVKRLTGKANQPEVLVRMTRNVSSTVTVVGEVLNSVRMPLTPGGERLLDALAAAGGVRQPVSKMTLQVTRGQNWQALPLDLVIRDPAQNVQLQAGDVITAVFQPLSFTALGATGRNEEVPFEAQGITLAQALARAGGLVDSRSDAQGVFVFRFEDRNALNWPREPVAVNSAGQVPVVYRLDLRDPTSFFVMQGFAVEHKDVIFVSNAPAAELQKFLNLVLSIVYPVINTIQLVK